MNKDEIFQELNQLPFFSNMGLFTLLRSLESSYAMCPKIGNEVRFEQNYFRFGQSANLAFQPQELDKILQKDRYIKVNIKGFGLFGPNGPLPLHISEYTYSKKHHQKEQTFNDFLDMFHHRLISLFYKAWRNAQDVVSLDHHDTWMFSRYIASIAGVADHRDFESNDHLYNQLYYSSYFLNKNMPIANLKSMLINYFKVPIEIKENIGQWLDATEFSTSLSIQNTQTLGEGLLIGDKIFDATQKFRIQIGPLSPDIYLKFLQGKEFAKKLLMWVEQFCRYQYQWDIELIIDKVKIDQKTLGQGLTLGFTSWIGQPETNPIVIIKY